MCSLAMPPKAASNGLLNFRALEAGGGSFQVEEV